MKPQIIVGAFGVDRAEMIAGNRCEAVILDLKSRFVFRSRMGRIIGVCLPETGFNLLFLLSVVQRLQIEDQLWGGTDAHIVCLRRRVAPLGLLIKAEHGRGFELFDAPDSPRGHRP